MKSHITVASKYTLLKRLATGGMAEIFLAQHTGLNGFEKLVVLKRILPHLKDKPEYVRMFLDEARIAAYLNHSNVVHTFEVGEDRGTYFMAMEYLQGIELRYAMIEQEKKAEPFPLNLAVGIIAEICSGAHYAHTKRDIDNKLCGIVHRDLSPQNIILTLQGEVKIIDFGIAKFSYAHETACGMLKGKFRYMSPEQVRGERIDARTDQFAIGIMLYEITTQKKLFTSDSEINLLHEIVTCTIKPPSAIIENYPPDLEKIVLKALSKKPADRFSNCEELGRALDDFMRAHALRYSPLLMKPYVHQLCAQSRHVLSDNADAMNIKSIKTISKKSMYEVIVSALSCLIIFGLLAALLECLLIFEHRDSNTSMHLVNNDKDACKHENRIHRHPPVKFWGMDTKE